MSLGKADRNVMKRGLLGDKLWGTRVNACVPWLLDVEGQLEKH